MPTDTTATSQQIAAALATFGLIFGLIGLVSIVFTVIIYWKIFSKAGYSGAMSLLMFVPIANIVALCILAFGEWPIYRELNQLRQMARGVQYPPPQYPQNPQYQPNQQNPQYRG
jgi:heme/copper-type cytochrome/quinol oxidase subunit 2